MTHNNLNEVLKSMRESLMLQKMHRHDIKNGYEIVHK